MHTFKHVYTRTHRVVCVFLCMHTFKHVYTRTHRVFNWARKNGAYIHPNMSIGTFPLSSLPGALIGTSDIEVCVCERETERVRERSGREKACELLCLCECMCVRICVCMCACVRARVGARSCVCTLTRVHTPRACGCVPL